MVYDEFAFFRGKACTVYEIYPESEMPHLIPVAHFDYDSSNSDILAHLLPGTVIWFRFYINPSRIAFNIWDYRLNYSASFSVDLEVVNCTSNYKTKVYFNLSKALKVSF